MDIYLFLKRESARTGWGGGGQGAEEEGERES